MPRPELTLSSRLLAYSQAPEVGGIVGSQPFNDNKNTRLQADTVICVVFLQQTGK
jgi:hypothetical protein